MSKATKSKPKAPAASARGAANPVMQGNDLLVKCLEREGVEAIFAYPGGASMEIHQALTRSKQIRTYLPRHEQGGVFAAEGYARVSGSRGLHGHERTGRHQPRQWHCRRLHGFGAARRHHGPGAQAMIGKGAFRRPTSTG